MYVLTPPGSLAPRPRAPRRRGRGCPHLAGGWAKDPRSTPHPLATPAAGTHREKSPLGSGCFPAPFHTLTSSSAAARYAEHVGRAGPGAKHAGRFWGRRQRGGTLGGGAEIAIHASRLRGRGSGGGDEGGGKLGGGAQGGTLAARLEPSLR